MVRLFVALFGSLIWFATPSFAGLSATDLSDHGISPRNSNETEHSQTETGSETGSADRLAEFMSGNFASTPDEKGYRVVDFRTPIAKLGEGEWVYYQRNQGIDIAVQKKAYRQRVLQLLYRPMGGVTQRTWSFVNPDRFAGAPGDADILKEITLDDLTPTMEQGCDQIWDQVPKPKTGEDSGNQIWEGSVDPKNCTIFSKRRSKRIGIGSQTRLSGEQLMEAERGFDLDGTQLWGTPPGQFTTMVRVD